MIALACYLAALGLEWLILALCGLFFWRWPAKYAALFASIQCAAGFASPLWLAGLPICAFLALVGASTFDQKSGLYHWPRWAWVWDNEQDGVDPHWYEIAHPGWSKVLREFVWTALRNSVSNFRFVRGVSGAGRPMWYWTGTVFGAQRYAKAGWESSTWPSLSAGSGKGY